MASYNRIVLMGNLTRDPQLSYTPANVPVCKFGIATNRKWRDRDGADREDVCFIDCTLFGKGGEVFNQYMSKGRSVLIEGRLQLDQWTTPEGEKKSKHQVLVENFTFLGDGRGSGGGGGGGRSETRAGTGAAAGSRREAPVPDYDDGGAPPPNDNDIPF
ncbi:MAG TPA: single-stranded DNA-binding protein [Phycisphaerae bacterium]|nr:single-stranded DNA-binding protein [Phycisphaerae bacterium]HNU45243.1 single-stranded DNA-binding protein [Phycisphaerae bacterium]